MASTIKISKSKILEAIGAGTQIDPGDYDLGEEGFLRVDEEGSRIWLNQRPYGLTHRDDGPAIEYCNGRKEWWQNGNIHRENGPAIEDAYGNRWWYYRGLFCRVGGPAVELVNGYRAWHRHGGKPFRKDGPAIEMPDLDTFEWPKPSPGVAMKIAAFEAAMLLGHHVRSGWHLFGEEFECQIRHRSEDFAWYHKGLLHRDNAPAIRWESGKESWYRFGFRHSRTQPSLVSQDHECWFLNDQLHRDDGPASIRSGLHPEKSWYINGELHRVGGPAVERGRGICEWWLNGRRHRDDGPAYESPSGFNKWYRHGLLHREEGPAVIRPNGKQEWWRFGVKVTEYEFHTSECNAKEEANAVR